MRLRRLLGFALPLLAIVAIVVVAVTAIRSWDDYERELASRAGALLGVPVQIDGMRVVLWPNAGLALDGVRVGSPPVAHARSVHLLPSLHGWGDLAEARFDLRLEGVTLPAAALGALCSTASYGPRLLQAGVHGIDAGDVALTLPGAAVEGLSGSLTADERTPTLALTDATGKLHFELRPGDEGHCTLQARAADWHAGGLNFERLEARGRLDPGSVELTALDGSVAGGIVAGSGRLAWGAGALMEARLSGQRLDAARMLPLLGVEAALAGSLDARLALRGQARTLDALPAALAGSGEVSVARGRIERFDLIEAARSRDGSSSRGGSATSFEQLRAQLQFQSGHFSLSQIHLDAGALRADGHLAQDRGRRLDGMLTVEVSNAGGTLRVPVRVQGTWSAPELVPQAPESEK